MKRIFIFIAVVSILGGCYSQYITDPCDPEVYQELDNPHRSTGFVIPDPSYASCDDTLERGWYRFTSLAGGELPTECQETNKCGTTRPVWMNGAHPAADDDIVMRHACVNLNNSDPNSTPCCEDHHEIFVKNCTGFYVYYLGVCDAECPMAYCAGSVPPCPIGKWSNTSFPPCKDIFPVMDAPPVLTGPIVHSDKSVEFRCEVVYGPDESDQVFEVEWIFSGKEDKSIQPQLLTGSTKIAFLKSIDLSRHTDTYVGCRVRSYYIGNEQEKSEFFHSNTTFFGILTKPVLTGPILRDGTSFEFQCSVVDDFDNPDQEYEVTWTFDGQEDSSLTPEIVTGSNMTLTLDGLLLKGHLNTHVGCQVRLIYQGSGIRSSYVISITYFAGIEITPKHLVTASSVDSLIYFTLTSTVPIICDNRAGDNSTGDITDCCLTFRVNANETAAVSFLDSCEQKVCASDWNMQLNSASIKIGLVAKSTIIEQGDRYLSVSFEEVTWTYPGLYLDIFTGVQLDTLQVKVLPTAVFQCRFYTDPHITYFDSRGNYLHYEIGDYTAFEVPDRDFSIQIRNAPCYANGGQPGCVCGLVVRERNDIIKIHGCDQPRPWSTATLQVAYNLSDGTVVQRSPDGKRFGIYLPSGVEIKYEVTTTNANVYILTSPLDLGRGRGLCGTNDGISSNDCTGRDGTVYSSCNLAFRETWREVGASSFFQTVPDPLTATEDKKYCSCSENVNGNSTITCSAREHILSAGTSCSGCVDVTGLLKPSYKPGNGWSSDPSTPSYVLPDVPPSEMVFEWPNIEGITEDQARNMCRAAVEKSQLYPHCQGISNMTETLIEDCMLDILVSGTTDFVDLITAEFTSNCQVILATDPGNYEPGPDGNPVLKPEFSEHICPMHCFEHGHCGQGGHCVCETGWEGETCHIQSGTGPQLHTIIGGTFCDITERSCTSIYIEVSNINLSIQLQCHIQPLNEYRNAIGAPFTTRAVFLTSNRIMCPLPELAISFQHYSISVTNDGFLFGNALTLSVFDSTCMECDSSGCQAKSTACHIDHVCYKDGESHTKVCDISKDTTKWTYIQSSGGSSSGSSSSWPQKYSPDREDEIKPCPFCVGK